MIYKENNILDGSSLDTDYYKLWKEKCIEKFWNFAIFSWYDSDYSYMCNCKEWYDFWWKFWDKCMPLNEIDDLNNKFNSHFINNN